MIVNLLKWEIPVYKKAAAATGDVKLHYSELYIFASNNIFVIMINAVLSS